MFSPKTDQPAGFRWNMNHDKKDNEKKGKSLGYFISI